MTRLTRPPKRFAIVGALLLGFLPGAVQAKWIKATVSGNIDATGSAATHNLTAGGPVSLDFTLTKFDGSNLLIRVSGSSKASNIAGSDIGNIEVSGSVSALPSTLSVDDFLTASTTSTTPPTYSYNCSNNCNGTIQTSGSGESPITFQWMSAKFERLQSVQGPSMQSVPGPLPLTGLLAAFRFSRKIRNRIKSC
jgi:hypothetical protein